MSFFRFNQKVIFIFFILLNLFLILYIFMATKHAFLEQDIARIQSDYKKLVQENENMKIKLKTTSEEKIFFKGLSKNHKKKSIKEIPIVKFF